MKKFLVLFLLLMLSACSKETIPEDAEVATCVAGDTFQYVFRGNQVYEFQVNGTLQEEGMLKIVQDEVYKVNDARTYFDTVFAHSPCTYSDYVMPE